MVHRKEQGGREFVVIWEFSVREGEEHAFEQAYGPGGEWVKLFRRDRSYLRTELVRDVEDTKKYLTLDYWASETAYNAFREHHAEEYEAIDAKSEHLTVSEREIGRYVRA